MVSPAVSADSQLGCLLSTTALRWNRLRRAAPDPEVAKTVPIAPAWLSSDIRYS